MNKAIIDPATSGGDATSTTGEGGQTYWSNAWIDNVSIGRRVETVDQLIRVLAWTRDNIDAVIRHIENLREDGVTCFEWYQGPIACEDIWFRTQDPKVAEKYGFDAVEDKHAGSAQSYEDDEATREKPRRNDDDRYDEGGSCDGQRDGSGK